MQYNHSLPYCPLFNLILEMLQLKNIYLHFCVFFPTKDFRLMLFYLLGNVFFELPKKLNIFQKGLAKTCFGKNKVVFDVFNLGVKKNKECFVLYYYLLCDERIKRRFSCSIENTQTNKPKLSVERTHSNEQKSFKQFKRKYFNFASSNIYEKIRNSPILTCQRFYF